MSRTVRRKNVAIPSWRLTTEDEWNHLMTAEKLGVYWKRQKSKVKPTFKATLKKETTLARSDNGFTIDTRNGGAPADFRRSVERLKRHRARHDLVSSVLRDGGESYNPRYPKLVRDIGWFWD